MLQVVDPHVHFWNTKAVRYPWLESPTEVYSGDNRLLSKEYEAAGFLRDTSDIEVLKSVAVEANPADAVAEASWLQASSDDPPTGGHPHGIVAYVDLSLTNAAERLEQLGTVRNLRGIRQILNVQADPRYDYVGRHYMQETPWRQNLRRLEQYRWSFDLQIYPGQVRLALEVIDANPSTLFIVNHSGMCVGRGEPDGWNEWPLGLVALAARPHTAIKISGLAMFEHQWSMESFRPYNLKAIEAFAPNRCMSASKFPIDRLHASYTDLWSAYRQIVVGSSQAEQAQLSRENAIRYYRLGLS